MHIEDIREILHFIQDDEQLREEVYQFIFDEDDIVSYQALWVCTHFSKPEVEWLTLKQDELIDAALTCPHSGKRRMLLNLLCQQQLADPPRVDSLAISIGTSHGANKFKPEQCTRNADGVLVPPPLRFDILKEIEKRIPGFPIVLHGSSSVPQDKVAIINKYGGALKDAIGIPEDQLREAAKSAVCKINIDSDGRLAMTAAVREIFATKPAEFDPRKYLGPARDSLRELYKHKLTDVLGSANTVK